MNNLPSTSFHQNTTGPKGICHSGSAVKKHDDRQAGFPTFTQPARGKAKAVLKAQNSPPVPPLSPLTCHHLPPFSILPASSPHITLHSSLILRFLILTTTHVIRYFRKSGSLIVSAFPAELAFLLYLFKCKNNETQFLSQLLLCSPGLCPLSSCKRLTLVGAKETQAQRS